MEVVGLEVYTAQRHANIPVRVLLPHSFLFVEFDVPETLVLVI